MKKFITILLLTVFTFCFSITSFASNEADYLMDESPLTDEELDSAIEVDDYDDLYEALNDTTSQTEQLKEYFEEQSQYVTELQDTSESAQKVVILDVKSDVKSEYILDDSGYSSNCYLVKYQEALILDKDGITKPALLLLSSDITQNNNIKPFKKGDTVYGYIEVASQDDYAYSLLNHSLTDESIYIISVTDKNYTAYILVLAILAILLLLIYAGKDGLKYLIPIFVGLDLIFIVFAQELEIGRNIILLSSLIATELIILISTLKNGWSKQNLVCIISSIIVTTLVSILALIFVSASGISGSGIIWEDLYDLTLNSYYVDSIMKSVINTSNLFIGFVTILSAVISAILSSSITPLVQKYAGSNNMTDNIITEAKGQIGNYSMIITIIFFVLSIPKVMIGIYSHVTLAALLNNEAIVSNVALLLFTVISSLVVSPITAIVGSILMGDVEVKQIGESKK